MKTLASISRFISLKEVLVLMENAAYSLGKLVQTALGLWMQVVEGIPRRDQDPRAKAAIQVVQAALHAASLCSTEQQRLVWMKQHVPGVSRALTDHALTQLDISLKRVVILQRLAKQAEPSSQQLSARLEQETESYWRLTAAGRIASFFAPVCTILRALSGGLAAVRDNATLGAHHGRRHQLVRGYQQGADLLKHIAFQIMNDNCDMLEHIETLEQGLQTLGVAVSSVGTSLKMVQVPGGEVGDIVQRTIFLQILATTTWLGIALLLPPTDKHHAAQAWLGIVDWWSVAIGASIPCTTCAHGRLRDLICRVLARPDLCEYMTKDMLSFTSGVLHAYGIRPHQMRDVGVPEEVVQKLLPLLQAAAAEYKLARMGISCSDPVGVQSDAADSHGKAAQAKGAENDFDSNDMQALIEMMYGSMDVKA